MLDKEDPIHQLIAAMEAPATHKDERIKRIRAILDSLPEEKRGQFILRMKETDSFRYVDVSKFFKKIVRKTQYATPKEKMAFLTSALKREDKKELMFFKLFQKLTLEEKKETSEFMVENNIEIEIGPQDFSSRDTMNIAYRVVSRWPPDKIKKLIFSQDVHGNTPLHYIGVGGTTAMFQTLLNPLTEEDRASALLIRNNHGETPFFLTTENAHLLQYAWKIIDNTKILSSIEKAKIILDENIKGESFLLRVVRDSDLNNGQNENGTRFTVLELLVNRLKELSPDQMIQKLIQKRNEETLLYQLIWTMAITKRMHFFDDSEGAQWINDRINAFLTLLPEQHALLKNAILNLENLEYSPLFVLAKPQYAFGRKVLDTVLNYLGSPPITQTEITENDTLSEVLANRFCPQSIVAEEIVLANKLAAKFEQEYLRNLANESESSILEGALETVKLHFSEKIKPYLDEVFYGVPAKELTKIEKDLHALEETRLLAIENKIRKAILVEIKKELKKEKWEEIEKKLAAERISEDTLISGVPHALDIVRPYFNSIVSPSQIAWRCYDPAAPTHKLWTNALFPTPESKKNFLYSTPASIAIIGATWEANSKNLRIMAAYYFLLADDLRIPEEREERIKNFIYYLSEIRRAHNEGKTENDPASLDAQSCGTGTITRIASSGATHPVAPMHKSRYAIIQTKMSHLIAQQFRMAIDKLETLEEKKRLLNAVVLLNEQNAETIIKHPIQYNIDPDFIGLEKPISLQALLKLRKQFIQDLVKNEKIFSELNNILENETRIGLCMEPGGEHDIDYIDACTTNVGGSFVASHLNSLFRTDLEPDVKTIQEKEQESFQNPYSTRYLPKTTPAKMIEKIRKQSLVFDALFPFLDITFSSFLKEKSLDKKALFDFTKDLVAALFDPDLTDVNAVLNALEGERRVFVTMIREMATTKPEHPIMSKLIGAFEIARTKTIEITPAANAKREKMKEKEENGKANKEQSSGPLIKK